MRKRWSVKGGDRKVLSFLEKEFKAFEKEYPKFKRDVKPTAYFVGGAVAMYDYIRDEHVKDQKCHWILKEKKLNG